MKRSRLILEFGPHNAEKAITYHLIRDLGLWVNILRATVRPGEEGSLLIEVEGDEKTLTAALEYLEAQEVGVVALERRVRINEENCLSCGACTGVCLSGALFLNVSSQLTFHPDACVACGICVTACPLQAIAVCF